MFTGGLKQIPALNDSKDKFVIRFALRNQITLEKIVLNASPSNLLA
jgi:hypothetical protein